MSTEEFTGANFETLGPSYGRHVGKVGYGIDDPRIIIELGVAGILAVAVGIFISSYTATSNPRAAATALLVGPGVGFLILVVVTALYWSSRLGKVREMTKIINAIPWGGGEIVLDLGCGRGLAMVLAAKRLESGYALGVDTWSKASIWGNDPHSILANALREKVDSKVEAVKGNSVQLPLADGSVDTILAGVSIHRLARRKHREALFAEIARVLKQGGRIGILDAGNGHEYSSLLDKVGLRDIEMHRLRFSSFPPFHVVLARKPYGD
ncbi:MAG: class I SAM-dependent methyltransferase [Thaumarchaeota archaeon]|nr:class I SAM-dependent methyltransferase [Nitrososphaerota archaeon]